MLKRIAAQVFFSWILWNFYNSFLTEHLRAIRPVHFSRVSLIYQKVGVAHTCSEKLHEISRKYPLKESFLYFVGLQSYYKRYLLQVFYSGFCWVFRAPVNIALSFWVPVISVPKLNKYHERFSQTNGQANILKILSHFE